MSKKRKRPPARREWTPFQSAQPRINPKARDVDPEAFDLMMQEYDDGVTTIFLNSLYVVHVRHLEGAGNRDGWIHLSIRHVDRKAIHDWRHFQRIKNELVGPDREALEVYPAEERLVDEANEYHLWVMPAGERVPVGFNERRVGDSDAAAAIGARQRRLDLPHSTHLNPTGGSPE